MRSMSIKEARGKFSELVNAAQRLDPKTSQAWHRRNP